MSYKANSTTYGGKTKSQIASLTGMSQGDSVYNTDINRIEYYTGSIWANEDLVVCVIDSGGGTFSEGQCCHWVNDGTYQKAVALSQEVNSGEFAGIVYRGGTGAGTEIVVAWKGIYPVKFEGATTANFGVSLSSTTNGDNLSEGSVSVGHFGIVLETIGAAGNAKVLIGGIETF